jgi:hypothetical protein
VQCETGEHESDDLPLVRVVDAGECLLFVLLRP